MYGDCTAVQEAWTVFDGIIPRNVISWNMMVRAFSKSSHLHNAVELFNKMPATNLVSWNLVITAYNQENELESSRYIFVRIPERNLMTWNAMLAAYAGAGHMEEAYMVFERIPEHSIITWTALMVGVARHSSVTNARALFTAMPGRNAVSWNAIIQAYVRGGHVREAEELLRRMPLQSVLSSTELLIAYGRTGPESLDAARVLFESIRYPDSVCWNAMLVVCSRCGDVTAAKEVFDRGPGRTVISWNNLVQGLGQNGHFDTGKHVFSKMPQRDVISWTVLLSQSQSLDEARQIFVSMPDKSVVPWTAMVVASARAGDLKSAEEVFEKSPQLDEVAWSAMISACSLNGRALRAVELFKLMDLEGLRTDAVALLTVIDACSIVATVAADSVHAIIRDLELELLQVSQTNGFLGTGNDLLGSHKHVAVGNAIINLYGKAGQPTRSKEVFDRMFATRNTLSWTALLSAYAHSGRADDCVEMFHLMKLHDICPDCVALMSVLSACSHAGMGAAAAEHLSVSVREFGVAAGMDHFVCVADALGRAGKVEEAFGLLESMPFEAGVVAWMSLLAACVRVGEAEVGSRAAERVWELDPDDAGSCIAMFLEKNWNW